MLTMVLGEAQNRFSVLVCSNSILTIHIDLVNFWAGSRHPLFFAGSRVYAFHCQASQTRILDLRLHIVCIP